MVLFQEGFSLIGSKNWLKIVRRMDCLLFGTTIKVRWGLATSTEASCVSSDHTPHVLQRERCWRTVRTRSQAESKGCGCGEACAHQRLGSSVPRHWGVSSLILLVRGFDQRIFLKPSLNMSFHFPCLILNKKIPFYLLSSTIKHKDSCALITCIVFFWKQPWRPIC